MSDGKRGDLGFKAGTEIFRRVLSNTVHQNEAFEGKRGEIGCRAFKAIFACMPQVKSTDDGTDGDVRTGFPSGFDRVDDPGMATARDQHAGGQQECLFLRDEIRCSACFVGEEMPAAVLARLTGDRTS